MTMRGEGRRFSLKTKLIAAVVALGFGAFMLVVAFAAGFVTGTTVTRTGLADACAAKEGEWDAGRGLCIEKREAPASAAPAGQTAYRCGDGTQFTLREIDQGRMSYQQDAATTRELSKVDPAANIMQYGDGDLVLTLVGPEARLQDASGRDVSCVLQ